MATHWVYMSGMSGCMPDNSGTAECIDDAINGAIFIFRDDLSETEEETAKSELRSNGIYYFERPSEVGAQYVSVSEEQGHCPEDE